MTNLRAILNEIANGYSKINYKKELLYFKHFSFTDDADLEEVYQKYFDKARKQGAKTESELFEGLDEKGIWTKRQEKTYKDKISFIKTLKEQRGKLVWESQKTKLDETIKKEEFLLAELYLERKTCISSTCESYAESKKRVWEIFYGLYRDKNLSERFYSSYENFEFVDSSNIDEIISEVNSSYNALSVENIKKVVCQPFFESLYRTIPADSPYLFFNKRPIEMTSFQSCLLSYAQAYRSMIENHNIPDNIEKTFDSVYEYVSSSAEKKKLIEKNKNKGAVSMVGATAKEMKDVGLGSPNAISPFDMLRKSGKSQLSAKDFVGK